MDKVVYVVHAIDTEGPLYESIEATFERLNELFGIKLEPSYETLEKIYAKKIDLDNKEDLVKNVFSKSRINSHESWFQIDKMLDQITSDEFRCTVTDSYGGGWVYSWFCLDHVGITGENPRRRDMGYHNVQDHYTKYFKWKNDQRDLLQWHYHALSITNDAHRAGSTYLNSDHIYTILARKIIDRHWFPASFRPGHHTERPDSHFFLEQWIPFDFGNDASNSPKFNLNESSARYGDWRRAPKSWIPYHPSHDDYQIPGQCRRWIARCLPIAERRYSISEEDVFQAFLEAEKNGVALLSVTNHDFRDMKPDVEKVMNLLKKCSVKLPHIRFKYVNAIDGMRGVLKLDQSVGLSLNMEVKNYNTYDKLVVQSKTALFGPQPFLALRTKGGQYYWQNFDFEEDKIWSYSFDVNNVLLDQISHIGVAANSPSGVTEVIVLDLENNKTTKKILNQ